MAVKNMSIVLRWLVQNISWVLPDGSENIYLDCDQKIFFIVIEFVYINYFTQFSQIFMFTHF